jgi:hypothetical protein
MRLAGAVVGLDEMIRQAKDMKMTNSPIIVPQLNLSNEELFLIRQIAEHEATKIYDNKVRFWLHPTLIVFIIGSAVAAIVAIGSAVLFPAFVVEKASGTIEHGVLTKLKQQLAPYKERLIVLQADYKSEKDRYDSLIDDLYNSKVSAKELLAKMEADALVSAARSAEVLKLLDEAESNSKKSR